MHIYCKHCSKGATAARWHCKCGIAWIACPLCRPLGFACQSRRRARGSASLASSSTIPQPPPPKKRRLLPSFAPGSVGFRGRGNRGNLLRGKLSTHRKRKASQPIQASILTSAGCSYVGPYAARETPCVTPPCESPCESLCPRPKMPKSGSSCTHEFMQAPSTALAAISPNSTGKRAREATGGDGRTPTRLKDLRAHKDLRAPVLQKASACVRGSSLCPLTGSTITEYCPACHG